MNNICLLHIVPLQSIEDPGSRQASEIARLFNSFNIAAAGMLLLVIGLVVFICIRYRTKKGDLGEGSQNAGNGILEGFMIGVPALLLGWFFYQSIGTARAVAPANEDTTTPDVIITGHQWWWEVEYPKYSIITANEIHLPTGRHIIMEMRSSDVIHDWWVPELGNKIDLVPGNKNHLSLDVTRAGDYYGSCSEFCGAQHAWMRIHVVAQDPDNFSAWLQANGKNGVYPQQNLSHPQHSLAHPQDDLAQRGAALFQSRTCANCHRIEGTSAIGRVGPDLSHVGSRAELLTGILPMSEANLAAWISHPQQIKPGARMPDFIFPRDTVAAIAHYLEQLK